MKHMKVVVAMMLALLLVFQCIAMAETGWAEKKDGTVLYSNAGKQVTGFYQEGNHWYYLRKNGMLKDEWVQLDTGLYHADANGHIDEGWQKYKGIWYMLRIIPAENHEVYRWFYIDGSAEMPFGKRKLAGKSFDISNKAAPLVGWTQYDGEKIYFNEDGTADVGWQVIDGNRMFVDLTGRIVKNQKAYIDGEYYAFDKKGYLNGQAQNTTATAGSRFVETDKKETKPAESTKHEASTASLVPENKGETSVEEKASLPVNTEKSDVSAINNNHGVKETAVNHTKPVVSNKNENRGIKEETASNNSAVKPVEGQETKPVVIPPKKEAVVETRDEIVEETIPFTTEEQDDPSRTIGEADIVTREGQNGVKRYTYSVTYTDGVETSRTLKSEDIITSPVNKVISHATGAKSQNTISKVVETEVIPFGTTTIQESCLYVGDEAVTCEGENGEKEVTYEVTKDANGNLISKDKVSERIIKEPVNREVHIGTFEPEVTYQAVHVDLDGMNGSRSAQLDAECEEWAQTMANNKQVAHSDPTGSKNEYSESVGGWASAEEAAKGVAAHGGTVMAYGEEWGVGVVARTETTPTGNTQTTYYACARGSAELLPDVISQGDQ